jgi:transposase
VAEDRALAPATAETSSWGKTPGGEPQGAGRHLVDSAQRGSLARLAERVSVARDVLAAAAQVGRAGRLGAGVENVPGRVERAAPAKVERVIPGREFCSRQKRGAAVGKTKRGKGTKWMVVVDGRGVPLGVRLYSASPSEVRLAEETLATIRVGRRHGSGRPRQKPARVIADKGYDSDALRERLRRRGMVLIAPHRSNRHRTPPQDGRVLRRYKKRWIVERSIAWLGNFRRLVVRYDRSLTIYQAFVHIACLMIVLRRVLK